MSSGSLEAWVESLVKRWEMEMTHFKYFEDVSTVDRDMFKMRTNDGEENTGEEVYQLGSCPAAAKCLFSEKGENVCLTKDVILISL